MSLTIGQKCTRVLRFLRGLRNPRVHGALAAHGFDAEDLDEGWEVLRGASDGKLSIPPVSAEQPDVYTQLDVWENHWFPIIKPSMVRRHLEIAQALFLNLKQTRGVEVSVSVGTFTRRVRALQKRTDATAKAACALLVKRGLTEEVLAHAEGLLNTLKRPPQLPAKIEPTKEDLAKAEEKMWAWYQEWSAIARNVIHDRRLLRSLGFLTASGSPVSDEEPTEEDIIDENEDATEPLEEEPPESAKAAE